MRPYRLTAAAVCALALACLGPDASRFPTTLVTSNPDCSSGPYPAPSIVADADSIRITGYVGTSHPCHRFESRAEFEGDTIVAELVAIELDVLCVQCVAAASYVLTIRQVPPGSYHLQLLVGGRRTLSRYTVVQLP